LAREKHGKNEKLEPNSPEGKNGVGEDDLTTGGSNGGRRSTVNGNKAN
jgi:hypothetical protein